MTKVLNFYENFHKDTKSQERVIKEKNFTYRNIISCLNNNLNGKQKILDIGCGAGTIDFYLATRGYKVFGIDVSSISIKTCKETVDALKINHNDITFKVMDFPNEKPVGKFDSVICFEVIEHLENDGKALGIIFDLLSSGGTLFLSTPSKNAPLYRIGYSKNFDREVGHLRRYSSEELTNILEKLGFQIVKIFKLEGVLRNFLFLNKLFGKSIKILNRIEFFSNFITILDNISIIFFGESDLLIVARKR